MISVGEIFFFNFKISQLEYTVMAVLIDVQNNTYQPLFNLYLYFPSLYVVSSQICFHKYLLIIRHKTFLSMRCYISIPKLLLFKDVVFKTICNSIY